MTKNKALAFATNLQAALRGPVFAVQLVPPNWVVVWQTTDGVAHILDTPLDAGAVLITELS